MGGLVIASAIIIFNVYMFMHVSVGVCAHVWSPDNNHKLLSSDCYLPLLRKLLQLVYSSRIRLGWLAIYPQILHMPPLECQEHKWTLPCPVFYVGAGHSASHPHAWRQSSPWTEPSPRGLFAVADLLCIFFFYSLLILWWLPSQKDVWLMCLFCAICDDSLFLFFSCVFPTFPVFQ